MKNVFKGTGAVLAGILAILAAMPALAVAETLPLYRVIEIALNNNGELKSLRAEKGIRDAGAVRAGVRPNPTLELEGSTGALTGSSAENAVSIGLSQEFLLAGKREKKMDVAERELAVFRWRLADRERVLKAEVKTAFYDLLLAAERLSVADRSIDLNRQLLAVAKDRLAAGDIPELEMNLVEVELTRSEAAKLELERAVLDEKAELASLMGLQLGETPDISGTLYANPAQAGSVAELKQLALANRPDLKALQEEKAQGDAEVSLARAEATPNLTAGIALSRETTAMEIGGVEGKDTAYTIGVKFSLPIPVFDKNQAGVQEASAKRIGSESRLSAAAKNAEREVEAAHAGFLKAEKVASLYKTSIVRQLEQNLKLTQEAYRLGEIGLLEVILEQKKYFEVSDGYLTALHARQMAQIKLESAVAADINGGTQ